MASVAENIKLAYKLYSNNNNSIVRAAVLENINIYIYSLSKLIIFVRIMCKNTKQL